MWPSVSKRGSLLPHRIATARVRTADLCREGDSIGYDRFLDIATQNPVKSGAE